MSNVFFHGLRKTLPEGLHLPCGSHSYGPDFNSNIKFRFRVKIIQGYGAGAGHFAWSRSSN